MPEVGVYPSQEINAFATGPAGNTLIAFSSNLVNAMSLQEIRGVVGHELSHLIHYDIARILLVQAIFDVIHLILSVLIASWLFRPSEEERRTGESNFIKFIFKVILFRIITAILRLIVDGVDLTEDENVQQGEPNSISLLKFNPEKKKRGLLDLFRTHPTLEERIERLEKLKKQRKLPVFINNATSDSPSGLGKAFSNVLGASPALKTIINELIGPNFSLDFLFWFILV
ncbi:11103_t:CDS:2 [Diversispora eburnea]|uniref:11103_t:CDS:1 n=1 Tax=Diversispora eburnea TaxID=1213867 RepID=A0A9N9ALH8_9GLOM|nr:11103_t:CDS:2 [Diversispora eburnea]